MIVWFSELRYGTIFGRTGLVRHTRSSSSIASNSINHVVMYQYSVRLRTHPSWTHAVHEHNASPGTEHGSSLRKAVKRTTDRVCKTHSAAAYSTICQPRRKNASKIDIVKLCRELRVCWRGNAQQLHRFPGGRLGHATQRIRRRPSTGPTRLDPGLPRGHSKGEGQQIFRRRCVFPSPPAQTVNLYEGFARTLYSHLSLSLWHLFSFSSSFFQVQQSIQVLAPTTLHLVAAAVCP